MQEKEVCLKKINKILIVVFLASLFLFNPLLASDEKNQKLRIDIVNYLGEVNDFSSKFIQTDGKTIEEGSLYIKNDRIRIDYTSPSRLTIVLAQNKAMYFNIDLNEVEYFNPTNSIADIFYKFFNDVSFLKDFSIEHEKNKISLKKIALIDGEQSQITVYLENNPIVIRKLEFKSKSYFMSIGLVEPKLKTGLNKKFFSMVNPLIN